MAWPQFPQVGKNGLAPIKLRFFDLPLFSILSWEAGALGFCLS